MHPVIRIVTFLLFTAALATGCCVLFLFVPGVIFFRMHCAFSAILPLLKRLRWFFLSLLLLGIFFPPGDAGAIDGLLFGLERIAILTAIVLAAHLLMSLTPAPMLIAALVWLFAPFTKLGFPGERLAVRLALVLETVSEAQTLRKQVNADSMPADNLREKPNKASQFGNKLKNAVFLERLQALGDKAALLFSEALHRGETAPLQVLDIPLLERPPVWQWSYPLGMCAILAIGHIIA